MKQTVELAIAEFYRQLEEVANNPHLGGKIGQQLHLFFQQPAVKERWLNAPASTAVRFHHAYDGGLVVHTVETFNLAKDIAYSLPQVFGPITWLGQETVGWEFKGKINGIVPYVSLLAAVALHDLHKIGDAFGNHWVGINMIKNGTVRSDKVPYVTNEGLGKFTELINESLTRAPKVQALYLAEQCMRWVPDGEQSLSLVRALSPELFKCLEIDDDIRHAIVHHDGAYGRGRSLLAGNETPLQMILHFADMWSSRMSPGKL